MNRIVPIKKAPLLQVEELEVTYKSARKCRTQAVSGISLAIDPGETFGLVGESGCGKSSLARAIMQIPPPTGGRVLLQDVDLTALPPRQLTPLRQKFQMIFQDPVSSLNPRRQVGLSIEAPLRAVKSIDKHERRAQAFQMLQAVGLEPGQYAHRLPFQLSGGQCQRVSIARALITRPDLLICDEPVSALDVSVQAQIINLLRDLKTEYGLAMLFISHDLAVVKNICDKVAVMYLGHLCEVASVETLFSAPAHPYTHALLQAIPHPDPERTVLGKGLLPGELPSATEPPSGCRFHTRCPKAQPMCKSTTPIMQELGNEHVVACHFPYAECAEEGSTQAGFRVATKEAQP